MLRGSSFDRRNFHAGTVDGLMVSGQGTVVISPIKVRLSRRTKDIGRCSLEAGRR
jgi:hypothetical protein